MISPAPELHLRLSASGPDRDEALLELRQLLFRGLRAGLSQSHSVNDAFIEDMTQLSMLRILENLHTFQGRSQLSTWALAIALRVAFTELRRKHWNDVSLDQLRESQGETRGDMPGDEAISDGDPELVMEKKKIVRLMRELIASELTERQREALEAELNGMPQDEIARQMGTNRNAIYKLAHDARKALKRCLENRNYAAKDIRELFAL